MNRMKRLLTESPLGLGLAITVGFLGFLILSAVAANHWPAGTQSWYLGSTAGRILAIAVVVALLARRGWLRPSGLTRPGSRPVWLLMLALAVLAMAASTYALSGAVNFRFYGSLPAHVALFLLVHVLLEEVIFRGLLLLVFIRGWRDSPRGLSRGLLVASLLFAAMHLANVLGGNPLPVVLLQSAGAFFLGVLLGALVLAGGSLYPAVFLHGMANLTAFHSLAANPLAASTPRLWLLQSALMVPLAVIGLTILRARPRPAAMVWRLQNER